MPDTCKLTPPRFVRPIPTLPVIKTSCRNGLTYEAVKAFDAEVANDAETALRTYDAVWAVVTNEAVVAFLA